MERPNSSKWLYNRPQQGIIGGWYSRNLRSDDILDAAVMLVSPFKKWQGYKTDGYSLDQVTFADTKAEASIKDPQLRAIWQNHSAQLITGGERIDPKTHISRYHFDEDSLAIVTSPSDWTKMSMGPMLRDGKIPEYYRDQIMPTKISDRTGSYTFRSPHLNHLVLHLALITSNNHLILTTRNQQGLAFEQGMMSDTVEQHFDPRFDMPLETTIESTVNKVSEQAELNLNPRAETIKVGSLFIEPNVNNTGLGVVAFCRESSEDLQRLGVQIIGTDRTAEFDMEKGIRTIPLDKPEIWVPRFYNPEQPVHGTYRLRMIMAASSINGYEQTLDHLYQGYPVVD